MPKFVRIVHALWPVASALRITLTHISKCTNWHTVEAKSLHSDSSILQTNAFDTCVCCCWFFFAIVHSTCYKFSTNAIQRIKTSIGFYSYEWSTNTHTHVRDLTPPSKVERCIWKINTHELWVEKEEIGHHFQATNMVLSFSLSLNFSHFESLIGLFLDACIIACCCCCWCCRCGYGQCLSGVRCFIQFSNEKSPNSYTHLTNSNK